jgi:hypothetical protein
VLSACNQYINPRSIARAEGPFAGVRHSNGDFFDTRTGELWRYQVDGSYGGVWGKLVAKYRLSKIGQPALTLEYQMK